MINESHRSDAEVHPLIAFVEARVKYCAQVHLYPSAHDKAGAPLIAHGEADRDGSEVRIWMSRGALFPADVHYCPEVGVVVLHDWREELVFTLAHELRHIEQFRDRRNLYDEVDAETFAVGVLNAFRRAEGRAEILPFPAPGRRPRTLREAARALR